MNVSEVGIALIKKYEGLSLAAYQDSVGVWTIGYGHTANVTPGDELEEHEADYYLRKDLEAAERCVNACVKGAITQGQFDALVSFVFNLGCAAFRKSTLLRHVNDGNDTSAASEFLKWVNAGGKKLAGLEKRRQAEQELFLA